MQADDKAEYAADRVEAIFAEALDDEKRAKALLEHIRYRAGLLLERRPNVFAFAHLTFQEYLAACAVLEGNARDVNAGQLADEYGDPRWKEVIALYCGVAPSPQARDMIEKLMAEKGTEEFAEVLADAFFAAGREIAKSGDLRAAVIERMSRAPGLVLSSTLERFDDEEDAPFANKNLGRCKPDSYVSQSFVWFSEKPCHIRINDQFKKLHDWRSMSAVSLTELMYILHRYGDKKTFTTMIENATIYAAGGPSLPNDEEYRTQAEVAFLGLNARRTTDGENYLVENIVVIFSVLDKPGINDSVYFELPNFVVKYADVLCGSGVQSIRDIALFIQLLIKMELIERRRFSPLGRNRTRALLASYCQKLVTDISGGAFG